MGLRKSILAASLAALFLTASADAALFWNDEFNYADGDLTVYDGTGDDVSGGLWAPHSGSTFPTSIEVSSGQAILRQGNPASEDATRLTGGTLGAGETLYASYIFSVEDLRGGVEAFNGDQAYFAHFIGFKSRVHLRDGSDANHYTLGLSGSSGEPAVEWGTDLDFDTQYQLIISYDFDSGVSNMWVDPASEASTSVSDISSASVGLTGVAIRQDFISGGDHAIVSVDAVAAGSDFASVLPEPASLALLALGGITVLRRRKA